MSKFGEVISKKKLNVILFYRDDFESCHSTIRALAAYYGKDVNLLKMHIRMNQELCKAFKVKTTCYLILDNSGKKFKHVLLEQDFTYSELVEAINSFINEK